MHRLQELHRRVPLGPPQWDPVTKKVVKCDYCKDRLDEGLKPACVTTCVTGCLSFGPADEVPDPRRERYAHFVLAEPLARRVRSGDERTMSAQRCACCPHWLDNDAAALSGAVPPATTLEAALPGLARAQP